MEWIALITALGFLGMIVFLHRRLKNIEHQQRALMELLWEVSPDQSPHEEVRTLLNQGHRIEAIRLVKRRYQCSLLQAKNIVEQIEGLPRSRSVLKPK